MCFIAGPDVVARGCDDYTVLSGHGSVNVYHCNTDLCNAATAQVQLASVLLFGVVIANLVAMIRLMTP